MEVQIDPPRTSAKRTRVEFSRDEIIRILKAHAAANGVNVEGEEIYLWGLDSKRRNIGPITLVIDRKPEA